MNADPRGRWFRVYARQVEEHPKFSELTGVELGAWTALRSAAELRDRAILRDRSDALLVLRRRSIPNAGGVFDRLVSRRLFDVAGNGEVSVHDRDDHDRPKYPSDDPEKVKDRVRRSREKAGNDSGNDGVTSGNENETIAHARASVAGAEAVSVSESTFARETLDPFDPSLKDSVDAFYEVTGRFPTDRLQPWIERLAKLYTADLFGKVLSKVYVEDDDPRSLMSRTEDRLKALHHRVHKAGLKEASRAAEQDALADIERQEREAWQKCGQCGELRRAHRADHEFEVAA